MSKRFISIITLVVMVLTLIPATVFADTEVLTSDELHLQIDYVSTQEDIAYIPEFTLALFEGDKTDAFVDSVVVNESNYDAENQLFNVIVSIYV